MTVARNLNESTMKADPGALDHGGSRADAINPYVFPCLFWCHGGGYSHGYPNWMNQPSNSGDSSGFGIANRTSEIWLDHDFTAVSGAMGSTFHLGNRPKWRKIQPDLMQGFWQCSRFMAYPCICHVIWPFWDVFWWVLAIIGPWASWPGSCFQAVQWAHVLVLDWRVSWMAWMVELVIINLVPVQPKTSGHTVFKLNSDLPPQRLTVGC